MSVSVGILVIGNEILDGIVLDTNSQWLINNLKPLNLHVKEILSIRDDIDEIAKTLNKMIQDGCGIIFTTGGLGPTFDDMTLKGVSSAFSSPLTINEEALEIVTRQYQDLYNRGIINSPDITDSRRKMAILPQGSRPLDNRVGGAPGVVLEIQGVKVFCLPGVPKELMWIFDEQVKPILVKDVEGVYVEKIIYLPLKDESTLAPIIEEVMNDVNGVYIKSMVKPYGEQGIRLWISARGHSHVEVEERVERVGNLLVQLTRERLPNG